MNTHDYERIEQLEKQLAEVTAELRAANNVLDRIYGSSGAFADSLISEFWENTRKEATHA
jgi:hypothetical protein